MLFAEIDAEIGIIGDVAAEQIAGRPAMFQFSNL